MRVRDSTGKMPVGPTGRMPVLRAVPSANRASEEMGIDFANTIELGFYFSVFEAGTAECTAPMIRGEKTRIRSKFGSVSTSVKLSRI